MDANIVKQSASGRWSELFVSLGIPADVLVGGNQEHPCPKCGGATRFRLIDAAAGALFCSHCFSQKNGDGLAAIQWWTGCGLHEAIQKAADFFGVKAAKRKKAPEDYLSFLPHGEDSLIAAWLSGHPLITLAAVKQSGGRAARFGRDTVIAFPYHGETQPTGYELRPLMPGGHIHKWDNNKKAYKLVTKYACPGSKKNLLGPVDQIKDAMVVVRAEGLTDMLVANSLLPEGWITVAVAGSANPTPWEAALFAGKQVVVVGDTDDSGQESAAKWAQAIASHAASVKVPRLPYPQTESGGKDLRDYLTDHGANVFVGLVENTTPFEPDRDQAGNVVQVGPPTDEETMARCLKSLGLDVFGESPTGSIYAYATTTRKTVVIRDVEKLQKPRLVQFIRDRAMQYVSGDPDSHQYTMAQVREAIAWAASDHQINPDEFLGRGIWLVQDRIVACNGNHISIWNGETLEYSEAPHFGGEVFELTGMSRNWYDQAEMVVLCQRARNHAWCIAAIERLVDLLGRWTWENESQAPTLCASLAAATLLQSAWHIRPHVAFNGTSGCGKSDCMKFLFGEDAANGIFGRLRWSCSDTSSSGISQSIGRDSVAIAIDEWDKQKPRMKAELLELLRAMSSGGSRVRGSAHGKSRTETLKHMLWFAGITSGIEEAADVNRVIQLGMLKLPGTSKWSGFAMPDTQEAVQIGKHLVAAMIVHGGRAIRLASEIESATVANAQGTDARLLRITAIPAACVTAMAGRDVTDGVHASIKFAEFVLSDSEHEKVESHTDMLRSVLSGKVDVAPGDKRPLSQILASYSDRTSFGQKLESVGVRVLGAGESRELAIGSVRDLVRDVKDRDARKLLSQIPGTYRKKVKIAGASLRCVVIPWDKLGIEEDDDDFE